MPSEEVLATWEEGPARKRPSWLHHFKLTAPDPSPVHTRLYLDGVDISSAVFAARVDYAPNALHRLTLHLKPALELEHDVIAAVAPLDGYDRFAEQAAELQLRRERIAALGEQGLTELPSGVIRPIERLHRIQCHGCHRMVSEANYHDCDLRALRGGYSIGLRG